MAERRSPDRRPSAASAVGVYVLVLVVLQIFLLTVALDAFHAHDAAASVVRASVSVACAAGRPCCRRAAAGRDEPPGAVELAAGCA